MYIVSFKFFFFFSPEIVFFTFKTILVSSGEQPFSK